MADTAVDLEWRFDIAKRLIQAGCVYAIAWGVDCEGWEECVDWAYLDKVEFQDGPDEEFVMTTSHKDESLYEALRFSIYASTHPYTALEETLIIQVGERFDPSAIGETYQRAVLDQD